MTDKQLVKIVIGCIIGFFLLVLLFSSWVTVGAGQRGVLLTNNAFTGTVLEPGLHFKVPFFQKVVKMNVQTAAIERQKSEAYSHDLQVVDIHSLVNYNVDPQATGEVYKQYGLAFESSVLVARIEAAVKETIAKYTAEELLSKRGEVSMQIENAIKTSFPTQFTNVHYNLVNEAFSPEFEKAIEDKQVALQKSEQAKNELAKAEVDAKARIATATGEAEAIRIQAQAITQQGGKEYVNLKWVEKWNGNLPATMLQSALPMFNVGQ